MSLITKMWGLHCKIVRTTYKNYYGSQLTIPNSVTFRWDFRMYIESGATVKIGEDTFFNNDCSINAMGEIIIERNCLFGEGVKIYDHNHRFRDEKLPIACQGFSVGSVKIGENSWIGSNVMILKGTNIGKHCIISAGCVVDSDIPSNSILYRDGRIEKIKE